MPTLARERLGQVASDRVSATQAAAHAAQVDRAAGGEQLAHGRKSNGNRGERSNRFSAISDQAWYAEGEVLTAEGEPVAPTRRKRCP
jgi:hypothetical protein